MKSNKYLILGASGQLGTEFQRFFSQNDYQHLAPDEEKGDITDFDTISSLVKDYQPDIILNCAAYNAVDQAEEDEKTVDSVNHLAVKNLAELCQQEEIKLVHYSSDYVFDGTKQNYYYETDEPNPLNNYGKSKYNGEKAIQANNHNFLIFRLSWVIGPGQQNFLFKLNQWAASNNILKISCDEVSVPTFTFDIVKYSLLAIEKGLVGIYHLVNSDYASRYELARRFISETKQDKVIVPVPITTFKTKAKRPLFSVMSNQKLCEELNINIPSWHASLQRYVKNNA